MKRSLCQPEHMSKEMIPAGAIAASAAHRLLVLGCSISFTFCFPWRATGTAHGLLAPECMDQALGMRDTATSGEMF